MARPSSVPLGESERTCVSVGRSPEAMFVAIVSAAPVGSLLVDVLKLSERMPTFTPVPSTPKLARAVSAFSAGSPSLVTFPANVVNCATFAETTLLSVPSEARSLAFI